MTKKEYCTKRAELMKQAQEAIDKNDYDKANDLMNQVTVLDVEYQDEEGRRLANERALSDESRRIIMPWMTGEGINIITGASYPAGSVVQDSLFLSNSKSMVDVVKATDPAAQTLLNMDGALGAVVRGIVTGKWDNPELKNVVNTTSNGTLIPQVLSAQVIDLMRNLSLFTSAGVPIVPMETNNLTISRVKSDPVFAFKEEGKEAAESSFELDGVELKAKTAYGYAYVTLEAIQSSKNLDAVIRQVFAQAMANAIDVGMLYGQKNETGFDTFAPSGIMNDEDVLKIDAGESASYDDILIAAGAIRKNNGIPTKWAVNAATDEALEMLKDSTGQYLEPPMSLNGMQKIVSNQLAYDEEKGSDALVFDPTAMVIGLQNSLVIKIIEDGECLKKGLVGFQIYSMLDCKAVRPKAICRIIGLK